MIVLHVIPSLNEGGAEKTLIKLCSKTLDIKHVVVCLMGKGKYDEIIADLGIDLYYLNLTRGSLTFSAIVNLYNLIILTKPDVIQTWMYHSDLLGGILGRLAGVKKVVWCVRHENLSYGTIKKSTYFTAKLCALLSRILPFAVVSASNRAITSHVNFGYTRSKFVSISNGYNGEDYCPNIEIRSSLRRKYGIKEKQFLVGMVARWDHQKDHQNLLSALRIAISEGIDLKCFLAGTGMDSTNAELIALIRDFSLDSHIILLGSRTDVVSVYNALDIHILSSLGEAFPNVVAESMLCGIPNISTDVGDAKIIVDKYGWVVPSKNSSELAKAIIKAHVTYNSQMELFNIMKVNARDWISKSFSIEKMVLKFREIWGVTA